MEIAPDTGVSVVPAAGEVTALAAAAFDFCGLAAAAVGAADLDNTDVVRDLSFHCIVRTESRRLITILGMWG
ncbi:hypothetical protein IP86_10625 [Rhodopseudomonas sp. AAP120]|nr:hypothetical protein IP86_10625 [Rhodopseudomonas sp. AAP120]